MNHNMVRIASPIPLHRSEPAYRQVANYFRQAILSGELACGAKLPAVQALAHQFQTSVFTIQTAMSGLVKEGLLERRPRIGTIVKGPASRLTSVGIYFTRNVWDSSEESFYQAVSGAIQTNLTEQNVRTHVWIDTRPEPERATPFPPLLEAVKRREIQAVIGPLVSVTDLRWLPTLTPATSFLTGAALPNRVNFDMPRMVKESLAQLREQGCRSVGFICTAEVTKKLLEGEKGDSTSLYDDFFAAAKDLGLETRDAWVHAPTEYLWNKEQYGYEEFLKLWDQEERPEGLLVYPDVAARGALTAVLARGISVPKDLKLAVHINDRNPYPCPVPVTQIITRVGAVAEALISIVRQQMSGLEVHPIALPFTVRHHQSSLPKLRRDHPEGLKASKASDPKK